MFILSFFVPLPIALQDKCTPTTEENKLRVLKPSVSRDFLLSPVSRRGKLWCCIIRLVKFTYRIDVCCVWCGPYVYKLWSNTYIQFYFMQWGVHIMMKSVFSLVWFSLKCCTSFSLHVEMTAILCLMFSFLNRTWTGVTYLTICILCYFKGKLVSV
jgi:hypothetical protein